MVGGLVVKRLAQVALLKLFVWMYAAPACLETPEDEDWMRFMALLDAPVPDSPAALFD
jgi:hypothetical protein